MQNDDTNRCTKCGEDKPVSEFRMRVYPQYKGDPKFYPRAECKECEKRLRDHRTELRKTAPEIPDKCECCSGPMHRPRLDHDHVSGEFRGWICAQCNDGLGKFGDTLEGVANAYNYLLRRRFMSEQENEKVKVTVEVEVPKNKTTTAPVTEGTVTERTLLLEELEGIDKF